MAEWTNAALSKSVIASGDRRFESSSLRQYSISEFLKVLALPWWSLSRTNFTLGVRDLIFAGFIQSFS